LFYNIPFQEQIDNMTDPSATGFFTLRFFILHTSQEDVDSGSPEWTLGDDGLPPAEPIEEDAEDNDDEDEDSGEGDCRSGPISGGDIVNDEVIRACTVTGMS
jgi:hypothetical protein